MVEEISIEEEFVQQSVVQIPPARRRQLNRELVDHIVDVTDMITADIYL